MQNHPPPSRSAAWESRAALEALFAPKPAVEPPSQRSLARMVVAAPRSEEPRAEERTRRLSRLLSAEGKAAVTRATRLLLDNGFTLPREQEVQLTLLEHEDEARVRTAIAELEELLAVEAPRRRALLESRLKRLQEGAEEDSTRALAGSLLRRLALASFRGRA